MHSSTEEFKFEELDFDFYPFFNSNHSPVIKTWGHMVHYGCLNMMKIQRYSLALISNIEVDLTNYKCAMCKAHGNTFIPPAKELIDYLSSLSDTDLDSTTFNSQNYLKSLFTEEAAEEIQSSNVIVSICLDVINGLKDKYRFELPWKYFRRGSWR